MTGMADADLDVFLRTCRSYLDTQHRLLDHAVALDCMPPALVIAMDAALEQLETATSQVCGPEPPPVWWEPGE
jgi:hypothetical protein